MSGKIECFESIPGAPKAAGPYSPIVRSGELYFLSGQVGLDPATSQLIGPSIEEQTRQVLKNLHAVLSGAGLTPQNVVKSVIFLKDIAHFQTVNAIYGEFFQGHKPARSTIQVAALPMGAIVEIEMIAVRN